MTFDLTYAPNDLSSTLRREVCLATGTPDYDPNTGDIVTPADVRMGVVFAIHGLVAVVAGVYYAGSFAQDNGAGLGQSAVFWFDTTSGGNAPAHTDFSSWLSFPVEVVGR